MEFIIIFLANRYFHVVMLITKAVHVDKRTVKTSIILSRVLVLGSNTVITMVTLSAVICIVIYSMRFVSLSAIACQ